MKAKIARVSNDPDLDNYQWFPRLWLTSEAYLIMTPAEHGAFRALLDRQWMEGSIPADICHLATLARVEIGEFEIMWKRVLSKFFKETWGETDRLHYSPLSELRRDAIERAERIVAGARKGGNLSRPTQSA